MAESNVQTLLWWSLATENILQQYRQPVPFTGNRRYIGVEAWLRDSNSYKRQRISALQRQHPNQNISYIHHDAGVTPVGKPFYREGGFVYFADGDYQARTVLPDGLVHEMLFSNVFGDPQVAFTPHGTGRLLHEASRLVRDDGKVVVRETTAPRHAIKTLTGSVLQAAGLQIDHRIPYMAGPWERLEATYRGAGSSKYCQAEGFYLFLSKTAIAESAPPQLAPLQVAVA